MKIIRKKVLIYIILDRGSALSGKGNIVKRNRYYLATSVTKTLDHNKQIQKSKRNSLAIMD